MLLQMIHTNHLRKNRVKQQLVKVTRIRRHLMWCQLQIWTWHWNVLNYTFLCLAALSDELEYPFINNTNLERALNWILLNTINYIKADVVTILQVSVFRLVWSSLHLYYYHLEWKKLDVLTIYLLLLDDSFDFSVCARTRFHGLNQSQQVLQLTTGWCEFRLL